MIKIIFHKLMTPAYIQGPVQEQNFLLLPLNQIQMQKMMRHTRTKELNRTEHTGAKQKLNLMDPKKRFV